MYHLTRVLSTIVETSTEHVLCDPNLGERRFNVAFTLVASHNRQHYFLEGLGMRKGS